MSEPQSPQHQQENEFKPMTQQGAKIAAFCFVALVLFFAISRPSMINEFSTNRMTAAGGAVLLLVLGSVLAFLGRFGQAFVSAFVWVCLVVFLLELFSSSSDRNDLGEIRLFLVLIVASASAAMLFLRKATKIAGVPPEFRGSELTWERLISIAPIGRFLGLVAAAFIVPSLVPLMGGGPDAAMAAGMLWAAVLFAAVIVALVDVAKFIISRRKASIHICPETETESAPNRCVPADRDPRERGSRPLNSNR